MLVKEEISGSAVEFERKVSRVLGIVLTFGKGLMRISWCVSHIVESQTRRKLVFMMKCQINGTLEVIMKSSFPSRNSMARGKMCLGF